MLKGPSGSGKTTLLSIVGCMSRPSAGRVKLKGREITSLPVRQVESLQFMLCGFIRKLALASVLLYTVFTALVTYQNYSPTDHFALFMNVPWFEKRMKMLAQPSPGRFGEAVNNENGFGDINLEARYNFWRSTRYDKFASILLGTNLPTGHFDGNRDAMGALQAPVLQLGKGTATFKGGMLYSQRWKDFWLRTSALYTVNPENDEAFAYGDVVTGGVALHYTPNYDWMIGVEMDASYVWKNYLHVAWSRLLLAFM